MPKKRQQPPDLKVVRKSPRSLVDHPENYRDHPPAQIEEIRASIRANGFYRLVVVAADGVTILAGHGSAKAAVEEGLDRIPVTVLPWDADSPQARKVLAGDNYLSGSAEDDARALADMLKGVRDDGAGLEGTGFDEEALAAFILSTRTKHEIPDFDAAADWVGLPDFEPADKRPKLTIEFETFEDRRTFIEQSGVLVTYATDKTYSMSAKWPDPGGREDPLSLKMAETDAG